MRKFLKTALCSGFIWSLILPGVSQAALIVDTGAGAGRQPLLNYQQWLAAEFTTAQSYKITDVSGWIRTVVEGEVTFALYTDGGNVPGSRLYSSTTTLGLSDPRWETISGLNWEIAAGNYWLAFITSDSLYRGTMPSGAPNSLANGANTGARPDVWRANSFPDIGVMIHADVAPVPVPAAAFMFVPALLGFMGLRRKAKNSAT